ncbi:PREDICTED: beta-chimaerin isoform X2 [Nicrophorus vespilloides]|uniref:Beta-chimaerin isoform X2 n=1 Tax=Nicrophorus vespilloides TaxID=110193 RepID=A0ABM1MLM5_NICVS|nr:PREDICTED: beta-chimaerin isoform X2 [Nicrophorus vespilloides]
MYVQFRNSDIRLHNEILSKYYEKVYRMQLNAPVPVPIICENYLPGVPSYLGRDYHGDISHIEANNLLAPHPNGAYLVRSSRSANGEFHTLSLKFNDRIHHYKLFYEVNAGLYVRQKRYDCVRSLVADGLVTMYLELKAPLVLERLPTANYQESPYMTLNKRKLRALTKEYARNSNLQAQPIWSPNINDNYEKSHTFKTNTFKGLNWCELCGNFLWGFTAQGVRCDDCGMIAHNKCSEKVPNYCIPDLKYLRGVFGIELTTLLAAHRSNLPFVLTKCVSEVEARGLTVEGIYRLSGFADEIDAIKMAFDKDGDKADLSQEKYPNINVITGALKLYLRLLPIPLITFIVHPMLVESLQLKNEDARIKHIRLSLKSMPKPHYDTLKFMIQHLKRVSQHSAINKMNPHNLATVFAPTLIGPPESSNSMLPDMTADILLIENLILHCDAIFAESRSIVV